MRLFWRFSYQSRYLIAISVVVYWALYHWLTQQLSWQPESDWQLMLVSDWPRLWLKSRSWWFFEPVIWWQTGRLAWQLSPLNLILSGTIGWLAGINLALAWQSSRLAGANGLTGSFRLGHALLSLISAGGCCVPTVIVLLGWQLTALTVSLLPWLLPVSLGLLIWSVWRGLS